MRINLLNFLVDSVLNLKQKYHFKRFTFTFPENQPRSTQASQAYVTSVECSWCRVTNRLDYQPLFGKMSPALIPRGRIKDRTRETAEIEPTLQTFRRCMRNKIPVIIKHGLRTGYKTRTRYKMRTTDYVGKNSAYWFLVR